MVDIMLTDHPSDRGGIECLEYMAQLNEGTEPIVLSATNDVRVPVDAWKKGAIDYLIKKDIRSSEGILDALRKASEKCKLHLHGSLPMFTSYLAYPEEGWALEDHLIKILGADMGKTYGILDKVFAPLLPVLREKNARYSIYENKAYRCLQGFLWSKSIGAAIWFGIAGRNEDAPPPPTNVQQPKLLYDISEDILWHGNAKIWQVTKPRDDFHESLADVNANRTKE